MRTLFDIGQVLTFILAFYGWNWLVLRLMTASLRDLRISLWHRLSSPSRYPSDGGRRQLPRRPDLVGGISKNLH